MRKPRVWDKVNQKMHYDIVSINWECEIVEVRVKVPTAFSASEKVERLDIPFEHCVIMDATGLRDKNGRDVYEGDIVQVPNQFKNDGVPDIIATDIVSKPGLFDLNHNRFPEFREDDLSTYYGFLPLFAYDSKDIEVIGNIWDGGDLLDRETAKAYNDKK